MMKKIIPALLLILFLLCTSCGKESGDGKDIIGFSFPYSGGTLAIDDEMTDEKLLGIGTQTAEPEEAPNCAFDGKDMLYTFADFDLETYPKGGKNYVYGIYLKTDGAETAEGIRIGDTKEKVLLTYGDADTVNDAALTYTDRTANLIFFFRDGIVTRIQYVKK